MFVRQPAGIVLGEFVMNPPNGRIDCGASLLFGRATAIFEIISFTLLGHERVRLKAAALQLLSGGASL